MTMMANKYYTASVCDVCRPYHSIVGLLKASFSLNWTNLLCLQLALTVFVSTTTTTTKLTTEPIALPLRPCACVLWSCIYYNLASFKRWCSFVYMYFTAPEPSDLISFSELEIGSTDLAMWKKHLLKACERNPCFKQTLISALIVVVNSSECKSD